MKNKHILNSKIVVLNVDKTEINGVLLKRNIQKYKEKITFNVINFLKKEKKYVKIDKNIKNWLKNGVIFETKNIMSAKMLLKAKQILTTCFLGKLILI